MVADQLQVAKGVIGLFCKLVPQRGLLGAARLAPSGRPAADQIGYANLSNRLFVCQGFEWWRDQLSGRERRYRHSFVNWCRKEDSNP